MNPRSCKFPEALSRARRTLNTSFLDFTHSFQTSLYWQGLLPHHSSIDCNHTCVLSFSPTQCSIGLNASPDLVLFFWMKQLTSLFTSQWHMMSSDRRNAQSPSNLSNTSTFSNRDTACPFLFYRDTLSAHTSPFTDIIKT